jgi:PmbA protein
MNFNLNEKAEKALKYAQQNGADETEIIISKTDILTVNIENGNTSFGGKDYHQGIGIRVVKNNSVGFSYTTLLSDFLIKKTVDKALSVSKIKEPDKYFKGFPEPKTPTKVDGIYDTNISNLTYDEAKNISTQIIQSAEALHENITATFGIFESSTHGFSILNSNDVNVESIGTKVSAGLRTLYDDGLGSSNGLAFQNSRHLKRIDAESIGERSANMALMSRNPRKIKSQRTSIMLDPDAVAGLFQGVLINAFYGDIVEKKGSYLYGKIGDKIASDKLTIIDDGALFDGCNSAPIDLEGVPTKRKTLIHKGVLNGYLYDKYTADTVGVESTGNAVRFGGFGPYRDSRGRGYRYTPKIGCTNFIIEKGEKSREKMIDEIDDGFIITFAVGGGSITSGDYSSDARNVFRVENGEITYPIRQAVFTGNIKDLLLNIGEIGVNTRSSSGLNPGEIYSPSIKIREGLIIGDL